MPGRNAARIVSSSPGVLIGALVLFCFSGRLCAQAPAGSEAPAGAASGGAAPAGNAPQASPPAANEDLSIADRLDKTLGVGVQAMDKVLFWDPFARAATEPATDEEKRARLHDEALVKLAASAGLFPAELAGLELGDYDAAAATLRIRGGSMPEPFPLLGNDNRKKAKAALDAWVAERGTGPGPLFYARAAGQLSKTERASTADVQQAVLATRATTPFVVLWLFAGAVVFTLFTGFINLRGFWHAVELVRGKYSDPKSHAVGEVSHFQALSAALSATVGLGNIAGVAVAVATGGPGAVFWMIVAGFVGMTSKFVECTLGQKYRIVDAKGQVSGGAMHYLRRGLAERGLGPLGAILSVLFAILCIGGSFGGGNMFQANQSFEAVSTALGLQGPEQAEQKEFAASIYGVILAVLTGLVIIGGIRRIANAASKIVPLMCILYIVGSLTVILMNLGHVPAAFAEIFTLAFTPSAVAGGFIGALITGVRRAAFSNEAGVGSAAIAHSAAKTDYPIREGLVALLEPFIDTVIVCTMSGLVIVISGAHELPQFRGSGDGSALTAAAWSTVADWFPYILALVTILFAYSTLISWSYYGERCWTYLFGPKTSLIYRVIFVGFVYVGSVVKLGNVIEFSDMMILGMALPNLLGCFILFPSVRADLSDYWRRYRAGEFRRFD
jgi:AGCS family alanine or glycine:cation symporter